MVHPDEPKPQNGHSDAADFLYRIGGKQRCAGVLVRHIGVYHRVAHAGRLFDQVFVAEVEVAVPGRERVHPHPFENLEVGPAARAGRDRVSSGEEVAGVQHQDAPRIPPADFPNERRCAGNSPNLG